MMHPYWWTLVAVIIGGVTSSGGSYLATLAAERRRAKRAAASVARAFSGEISALRLIVERRQYIEGLSWVLDRMRCTGRPERFVVAVRGSYFNVYARNVDKIGVLDGPLPSMLAKFYTLGQSVLEDFWGERDGLLANTTTESLIVRYEQLVTLLKEAMQLADRIVAEVERRYPA